MPVLEQEQAASLTLAQRQLAQSILTRLRARYARHIAWFVAVHDQQAGGDQPALGKMPGKAMKGWMYDDAASLDRVLRLGLPRASKMADIAAHITAAELKLAGL